MQILIADIRNQKHISSRRLAKMTGISKSKLNRIENGITSPTLDELEIIANATEVKITELFE